MPSPSHAARTKELARILDREVLEPGEPFECPYLPDRQARHLTLVPRPLAPGLYHSFMDLNFRRMGPLFYRPQCDACRECRMLRVLVDPFQPSRSQRRCLARNVDLRVEAGPPQPTADKHDLYQRYLDGRHDGKMDGSAEEFHGFLYNSAIETLEVLYWRGDRLVGVGITDVEPEAMSAVYCYFDPQEADRSLGVFNVLWTIGECRRRGIQHLYLGYYVRDCRKMSYKADYRPCELLAADGRWEAGDRQVTTKTQRAPR
jgi:arginine-tRNA-protein transferase